MAKWKDVMKVNFKGREVTRSVEIEEVEGKSGTYLIVRDLETGEVLEDNRPWQMKAGVS